MGEGGRQPDAEALAVAWITAAQLTDEEWALVGLVDGDLRDDVPAEFRWIVFAAVRGAFSGLDWSAAARMSGLPETVGFGELGRAIHEIEDFWGSVAKVFPRLIEARGD